MRALFPERFRHLEVDVNTDQVHQLERAHAKPAPDSHDAIDLIVRGDPLAQQAQSLQRERAGRPVGDEADCVGGTDRLPPHGTRDFVGGRQRPLRRALPGNHLHQPHQRRRIEEVHAANALGQIDVGTDRSHRQGGRVRGQDRLGRADAGQPPEQLALQVQILGRRLDHQLAPAQILEPHRLPQP
jgi:hypothetical protein